MIQGQYSFVYQLVQFNVDVIPAFTSSSAGILKTVYVINIEDNLKKRIE